MQHLTVTQRCLITIETTLIILFPSLFETLVHIYRLNPEEFKL